MRKTANFILFTSLCLAQPSFASTGYQCKMTSVYYGPMDAQISSSGIRIESPNLLLIIPKDGKTATYVNKKTRAYAVQHMTSSKNSWQDERNIFPLPDHDLPPVIKGKKGRIAGLNAQQYFRRGMRRKEVNYEFWTTQDLKIPVPLSDMLCMLTALPQGYGVPLRFVRNEPTGERVNMFETMSVKKSTVDESAYKTPTDLRRRMPNPVALMLDDDSFMSEGNPSYRQDELSFPQGKSNPAPSNSGSSKGNANSGSRF